MTAFSVLTTAEARSTAEAIKTLRPLSWTSALLARAGERGGLSTENMATLFEVRFGCALHDCGITPVYEHATGVGESSVDFAFDDWNIELLSFDESDAAKAATWEHGVFFGRTLMSPTPPTADEASLDESERRRRSDSRKQSPEGETLKAIERIVGKAENGGRPSKFPVPDGKSRSILVVDARAAGRLDRIDCRQIAYGTSAVPEWARYRWIGDDGREFPIIGAFDACNEMRGARHFRERVHFLGIVSEETFEREELQYFIRFYHNPGLFASERDALSALRTFPLGGHRSRQLSKSASKTDSRGAGRRRQKGRALADDEMIKAWKGRAQVGAFGQLTRLCLACAIPTRVSSRFYSAA